MAIAGTGVAGAYLYRLMSQERFRIDVYDVRHKTRCGVSPCSWAISEGFIGLIEASGLDPGKYILQKIDHVTVGEIKVTVEVMTIDKLRKRKPLNVGDALVIKNNSKGIGIDIGPAQAAIFLKRLGLS